MNDIETKKNEEIVKDSKPENEEEIQKPVESGGGNGIRFIILFSIILLAIIILLFRFDSDASNVQINYSYIGLALVGVIFHLMSRFRKLREEVEGFKWKEYGFDYFFRAFQAAVYVTVIENLLTGGETTGGSKSAAGNFSGNMVLISLFVGMYVRRVEEAFENLGDRFGDMLKGILGAYVERISPTEQRRLIEDVNQKLIELKEIYQGIKPKLPKEVARELEGKLKEIKEKILKRKIDSAEMSLLDLDFRIKDLKVEIDK